MYVDESGDSGLINSPTQNFILSGIVIHELNWKYFLDQAIIFRRRLKLSSGLKMRDEIHASDFLSKRIKLTPSISRNTRLDILKKTIDWLATQTYLSIITVKLSKNNSKDPFNEAWRLLIQRFENTIKNKNFPTNVNKIDRGVIVCDQTDAGKLTKLLREMRRVNYVPSMFGNLPARNLPLNFIIKDPIFRNSRDSYMVQFVDVVAYFAKEYFEPSKYVRQKGARTFYARLAAIINQTVTRAKKDHKIIQA